MRINLPVVTTAPDAPGNGRALFYFRNGFPRYKGADGVEYVLEAPATAITAHEAAADPHDQYKQKVGLVASQTTLAYDETTRTVTITGTAFDVFVPGASFANNTASLAHPNVQGGHFFYYDAAGTLVTSQTPWDLLLHAPVAYVFWDAANARALPFDERHNAGRDVFWHRNQHAAEGTKTTSGFAAAGYTLNSGATDAAVTFAIASGRVEDEDIRIDTQALPDDGPYTMLERVGAAGDWRITRANTLPFPVSGNNLQYNQNNGGTWQRTNVPEDNYINVWVFAVTTLPTGSITPAPTTTQQIILIPGQGAHATEALALAETPASLSWGTMPFQEIAPLYQVTLRYNAVAPSAYTNTARCAITKFTRIIGTYASVIQSVQTTYEAAGAVAAHEAASDPHGQYDLVNPVSAAVTYTAGGTSTVALNGGRTERYTATAAAGGTTWAVTGAPASKLASFILDLTNGGSQTQAYPAGTKFVGGIAPVLTAAGMDRLIWLWDGAAWTVAVLKDVK